LCKRIKTKQNKNKTTTKKTRKMVNHKKDTQKQKETKKASHQPSYLLLPNSQLLRGVPVQTHGEYKLPTNTDVFTFAAKKRIDE
jgi:hypothetical protein